MFAPLFGVVLVDHFILRRRGQGLVANLHWSALLAWLGGIATYHLLANLYPDVGATLPALVLAGLLQFILGRVFSAARAPAQGVSRPTATACTCRPRYVSSMTDW